VVGYPDERDEAAVVGRSLGEPARLERVLSVEALASYQRATEQVYVDRPVAEYAVSLASATRALGEHGLEQLERYVEFGASPRGSINLVHGARALALLRGRAYALPQDVADLAPDVLRHRLVLSYEALADGISPDAIVSEVLAAVDQPRIDLARAGTAA